MPLLILWSDRTTCTCVSAASKIILRAWKPIKTVLVSTVWSNASTVLTWMDECSRKHDACFSKCAWREP